EVLDGCVDFGRVLRARLVERKEVREVPSHSDGKALRPFGLRNEQATVEELGLVQVDGELPDRDAADEVREPGRVRPVIHAAGHVTTCAFAFTALLVWTRQRNDAGRRMREPVGSDVAVRSWTCESYTFVWSMLSKRTRSSSVLMIVASSGAAFATSSSSILASCASV